MENPALPIALGLVIIVLAIGAFVGWAAYDEAHCTEHGTRTVYDTQCGPSHTIGKLTIPGPCTTTPRAEQYCVRHDWDNKEE